MVGRGVGVQSPLAKTSFVAAASLVVTTKRWSTVSGQSGNKAMERDGYCGRAKKDFERAVGEAGTLGVGIWQVQNKRLDKQMTTLMEAVIWGEASRCYVVCVCALLAVQRSVEYFLLGVCWEFSAQFLARVLVRAWLKRGGGRGPASIPHMR